MTVLAVFLILRSSKKSGFDSPESDREFQAREEAKLSSLQAGFKSPETEEEADAQRAELRLEYERDVYQRNLGTSTEAYGGLELGQGNSAILKDLEGAVNQRNYPMVGKDQGALDYTSGPIMDVSPVNAVPVDVNTLPYPIEGYNLLPEFLDESDIEGAETPLLDLYVPNVPMISPMMPSSPLLPPPPMMPPPLLPTSSTMMPPSLLPTSSTMMAPSLLPTSSTMMA